MRSIVGCIVFLNGILLTRTSLRMSDSDPSNCDTLVSQLEQRYVPYTETYRTRKWGIFYQIRTRQNYKIVYTTTWRTIKRCCDGYVETTDNSCSPICWTNCTHGHCEAPDRCGCDDGYRATHDNLHCEPICHELCTPSNHAHCEAPNSCVCDSGYRSVTDITFPDYFCEPICETACVNGKCTAPNVCLCEHGYANVNDTSCAPNCEQDCTFGTCTAPNTCTCEPGYRMNERNVCEPICSEPCQMGKCVAPESCSCNDGYGLLNSSSKYACEPICEKACVNGACTAPGICVCNQGYRFNGPEEEKHVCKPFCAIPCEPYGTCVAPNACACFDGYRPIAPALLADNQIPGNVTEEHASACEPICDQGCVNGKCVEPGVCRCKPGYRPSTNNDSNVCEPVCDPSCGPNSACTVPNVCTCDPGYRPTENDVAYNCEPICETDCGPNGTCAAPDLCACNEGYLRSAGNLCEPFCSSCYNGSCVRPNECRCFEGYAPTNDGVCVPHCEHGCENGDCLGPNECRCRDGFYMLRDNGSCARSCTRDCNGHGVCEDDQKDCRCSYGWTGSNCDRPTVCIQIFDSNDTSLDRFTVYNQTNDTLIDARRHAPYCYRCNGAIGNRSLCFVVPVADDGSSSVGCFVETESPCYPMYESSEHSVSRIAGTVGGITMLIIVIGATAVAYFLIRRRANKRVREVVAQSQVFRGSISDQPLLPDENAFVH